MKVGDSVSINGACLTITKISKGTADFEIVDETIKRTCLGLIKGREQSTLREVYVYVIGWKGILFSAM